MKNIFLTTITTSSLIFFYVSCEKEGKKSDNEKLSPSSVPENPESNNKPTDNNTQDKSPKDNSKESFEDCCLKGKTNEEIKELFFNVECKKAKNNFFEISENKNGDNNTILFRSNTFLNKTTSWISKVLDIKPGEAKEKKVVIVNAANSYLGGGSGMDKACDNFGKTNMGIGHPWYEANPKPIYDGKEVQSRANVPAGCFATHKAADNSDFKLWEFYHAVGVSQKGDPVEVYKLMYGMFYEMLKKAKEEGKDYIVLCAVSTAIFKDKDNFKAVVMAEYNAVNEFVKHNKDSKMKIIFNNFDDAFNDDYFLKEDSIPKLNKDPLTLFEVFLSERLNNLKLKIEKNFKSFISEYKQNNTDDSTEKIYESLKEFCEKYTDYYDISDESIRNGYENVIYDEFTKEKSLSLEESDKTKIIKNKPLINIINNYFSEISDSLNKQIDENMLEKIYEVIVKEVIECNKNTNNDTLSLFVTYKIITLFQGMKNIDKGLYKRFEDFNRENVNETIEKIKKIV